MPRLGGADRSRQCRTPQLSDRERAREPGPAIIDGERVRDHGHRAAQQVADVAGPQGSADSMRGTTILDPALPLSNASNPMSALARWRLGAGGARAKVVPQGRSPRGSSALG